MKPEEEARVKIDQMLQEAGWQVVSRQEYSEAIPAAAVRESLLAGNLRADYLLYVAGKVVGVVEAKREEINPQQSIVAEQAFTYLSRLPGTYPYYSNPLPLAYTSNGRHLFFYDCRTPNPQAEYLKQKMHTPWDIVKRLHIETPYAGLPVLSPQGLRDCQYQAITQLEQSLRLGKNRALIVLATGAGKTYTAVTAAYRLLRYTHNVKRILFLVDRNNLGVQAENEFGTYRRTEDGNPFNTIFGVERLRRAEIASDSRVVISTIQRLFSLLTGQEIDDTDEVDEETDIFNDTPDETPVELPANLKYSPDYFDLIIVDECHRSIYGKWRKVLEYFSLAKIIGLTATPTPPAKAFFNENILANYTLEQSIVDNVNVDCRIYRIKTQVTESGGAIKEGDPVEKETKYYGTVENIRTAAARNYTRDELNRSIINPAQIKLILQTYKDIVYTKFYSEPQRDPNFDYLPKTLIFALNERHANAIVEIAKEVFGRTDNRFVQKITYSAGDSNLLIRQFRIDKEFRIAVTCTLVATGTDIKPLEVLIFMRDVASETLYVQMKGRGVRTIHPDELRRVTPNAQYKDCFYLIDAVGVTESHKTVTGGGGGPAGIPLATLLELLSRGNVQDEYLRLLASHLTRIHHHTEDEGLIRFAAEAGIEMLDLAHNIYIAIDPENPQRTLPPFIDINQPNSERKDLIASLIFNPKAKALLLELNAGYVITLQPGQDTLLSQGFSVEQARSTTAAFEQYCLTHKDQLEALRIIYNNTGEPLTRALLEDLEAKLTAANARFRPVTLWEDYALLNEKQVRRHTSQEEKTALTNIIQLVRFAYHQINRLESLYPQAAQRFELWCGQRQRELTAKQVEIIRQVVNYIATNGAAEIDELRQTYRTEAAQLISEFGSIEQANQNLLSLSTFIIYPKAA